MKRPIVTLDEVLHGGVMIRLEKKLNRTLRKKVLEEFDGSNYYPAPDGRW